MKKFLRFFAVIGAAVITAGALFMFAGCTTKHPEITITYTFHDKDYKVDYTLSRNDAPNTVQHFIELADAGFYDGLCVHNYDSNFLYTGGYKLNADKELEEVDYFTVVKQLEEEKGIVFTQSVWTADDARTPLYTVYGEFTDNGVATQYSRENAHSTGALVMYYTDKGASFNADVTVSRADKGKENEKQPYQTVKYSTNSATSLFYTYTSPDTNYLRGNSYCVFGMAKNYADQLENGLLKAIEDYCEEYVKDGESFTVERVEKTNRYEPFEELAKGDLEETFQTPVDQPIIIKSVKVNKY